ncbi:hypothetical protein [Streptomyces sp. NPDC002490]|uniref:hypothetical protein n=1 Tax=Streptomyces sp. NPDC002490 TaxID=3154416 RepID=UPI003326362A
MRLRKANLAITVVAALAGAGMVAGRALVDGSEPLDLGPAIDVSGPEASDVAPSQTVSPPPISPQGPKTPLPTPTGTWTTSASDPPALSPLLPPAPERSGPAPTSADPPGGSPVPPAVPPYSTAHPAPRDGDEYDPYENDEHEESDAHDPDDEVSIGDLEEGEDD